MIDFTDHNINYVLASYVISLGLLAGMAIFIMVRDKRVQRAASRILSRGERSRHG